MLKGTREAVLHRMQPISVHGQLSYDVHYTFTDDPDSQMRVARVGPEALAPGLQDGDTVKLDFLVGAVTAGLGVAVVVVLTLRAMGEWKTIQARPGCARPDYGSLYRKGQ